MTPDQSEFFCALPRAVFPRYPVLYRESELDEWEQVAAFDNSAEAARWAEAAAADAGAQWDVETP